MPLDAFLRRVAGAMEPPLRQAGIRLTLQSQAVTARMEPDLMETVCMNLLDNARKAMEDGGEILLEGFALEDGSCCVQVTDQGKGIPAEELERVTLYFTEKLEETSPQVPRDERGIFAASREDIFSDSTTVYRNLSREFPFLAREDRVPKKMFFSRLFSAMNFTGFYSPYTGESNLNIDSPACLLPANIAHELAHQRGIASEQECNFLAIAAATSSENVVYQYSGYLMGYIQLSNALYRADRDRWAAVRELLPAGAAADLADHSAYWAQFDGLTARVSTKIYDSSLKSYGQADGIQSYGTVVDLLVAYF